MGRKVHPIGFRLKINRPWEARWFAGDKTRYRSMLQEDFAIRRYLFKELQQAAISKIDIDRYPTQVVVTIHTAKPGIVIGRKGDAVKKVRQGLETLTAKKVKVEVEEITKPDLDAKLASRAIKRAIAQAFRAGALGIKIMAAGRLAGAEMGRREGQMEGRVPRNTLRSAIDYGTAEALTTFGRIGVKVWIYTGEKVEQDEPKPETSESGVYVSQ